MNEAIIVGEYGNLNAMRVSAERFASRRGRNLYLPTHNQILQASLNEAKVSSCDPNPPRVDYIKDGFYVYDELHKRILGKSPQLQKTSFDIKDEHVRNTLLLEVITHNLNHQGEPRFFCKVTCKDDRTVGARPKWFHLTTVIKIEPNTKLKSYLIWLFLFHNVAFNNLINSAKKLDLDKRLRELVDEKYVELRNQKVAEARLLFKDYRSGERVFIKQEY